MDISRIQSPKNEDYFDKMWSREYAHLAGPLTDEHLEIRLLEI